MTENTARKLTVAMVGRQNSGKTSIMMYMTGKIQRPVNFPGSSVERGEATVTHGDTTLRIIDLPGIGSLDPMSPDEAISVSYLRGEDDPRPDVLCVVIDASKLSVELRLLARLTELGLPIVVALNKTDLAQSEGIALDASALEDALGLSVLVTDGLKGGGADALKEALVSGAGRIATGPWDTDAITARVAKQPDRETTGRTDRIDRVLLHRVWSVPIFLAVIYGIFQAIFSGAVPFMDLIETGQDALVGVVEDAVEPGALQSFFTGGLINGLGSIVIFLPQIVLLIFLVAVLEGTGYMARAAFILDRPLRKVGLSGRSFVPLASSFACAVPGILATRAIPDERDRIATIVVAPLMSCSARLPVYVLLIGAFFPAEGAALVLFSLYFLGIAVAGVVAYAIRRTRLRGDHAVLMMELPAYQLPNWRVVGHQVWSATRAFAVMAGTIIFAAAIVIWLLSYYPRPEGIHAEYEQARAKVSAHYAEGTKAREEAERRLNDAEAAAYMEQSYLAQVGKAVQPIFAPAGFDWRVTVGILAAFPARELIIPTLGVLYSVGEVDAGQYELDWLAKPEDDGLRERLRSAKNADGSPAFSPLIALALMIFFALCSQCAATLATIKRETGSWRWPVFTFTYMTAVAWVAAVLVYQCGRMLGYA